MTNGVDRQPRSTSVDAVIVGAGFSGLYMLYRLREMGLSLRLFEAGKGIGGTWYWNRYPGARCDIDSLEYSYSFSDELQQEWVWTERNAAQEEILRYIHHVADRFDLWPHVELETKVVSARFDELNERWLVATENDEIISAKYCIMATGSLSSANIPDWPGKRDYRGKLFHTGNWPHENVDFHGKSVGVVGTGSSGIQIIPQIAKQADQLHVFQRTPNFSIPARNHPLDEKVLNTWKQNYRELRKQSRHSSFGRLYTGSPGKAMELDEAERNRIFEEQWDQGGTKFLGCFADLLTDEESNSAAAQFVRHKIRETVKDSETAELLTPNGYPIGTKRICADSNYYETFNRPNVTLVDVRTVPIERFTTNGLKTNEHEYKLDAVVFATGFDAMTGTLNRIDITGRAGRKLRAEWEAGPRTYLGLMINGFPNFFIVAGAGSPSVLSNVVLSIEQHVEWISACIDHLESNGYSSIEAEAQAQDQWVRHVNDVAFGTLFPKANSWYMGANVAGKPRVFMPYVGGVGKYREICDDIALGGYRGFHLRSPQ